MESLLQNVIDEMLEGFQVIGRDWRYLYVNETVAKQGKKKKEDLLNKTMMECYHGIEKTFLFGQLTKCMNERISIHMENEFEYPDKTKGWFRLYIQPCEQGILILSVDITAQKLAEKKLLEKIEQINQLANENIDCEEDMSRVKEILSKMGELVTQKEKEPVKISVF